MQERINFEKIMILEPHIDDVEVGCSIFLESLSPDTKVTIVTLCCGTSKENYESRKAKRERNIQHWESIGLKIKWLQLFDNYTLEPKDTEITRTDMNKYCKKLLGNVDIEDFDLILIPQNDLHFDHRFMNEMGLIISRNTSIAIFEYIIMNSFPDVYMEEHHVKWNLMVMSDESFEHHSEICNFDSEKSTKLHKMKIQKMDIDGTVRDRFNILKLYL